MVGDETSGDRPNLVYFVQEEQLPEATKNAMVV
jgi:hypothetical protein